jgi:serine-type D-Ala-D-Ala carboxypeptidase/endopeptidase (penicillin-binding protein 4)
MKLFLFLPAVLATSISFTQPVQTALLTAVKKFETDNQMKHALYSLYVMDANTGKPVFEKNSQFGLATASCLKLVTSATAFEKLGKEFKYRTTIGYNGKIKENVLEGDLYITGSGDPTLGSWRWPQTKEDKVLERLTGILKENKIKKITGKIFIDDCGALFHDVVPGGWTWEDIGNYYGAPARVFNWHENQYDVFYSTGAIRGEQAEIVKTEPVLPGVTLNNYVTANAKGSGDQTIIYLPPYATTGYITGTVPVLEKTFKASGAIPDPTAVFINILRNQLNQQGIVITDSIHSLLQYFSKNGYDGSKHPLLFSPKIELGKIESPSLDSIVFWFMRRSINLYGEALLRTSIADSTGNSDIKKYEPAIAELKTFWKAKGIEESALNIYDGSGLSPQNRVTTDALVKILQYARTRPWFSSYYNSFPEYNGMKLKSGTIGDVKGFAGYHKAKNGKEYIIAFLVNNYDGKSSDMVGKMYQVLDVLK